VHVLYQTKWFPVILDDLEDQFSCYKPLWIQWRIGRCYVIINVYWIVSLVIVTTMKEYYFTDHFIYLL